MRRSSAWHVRCLLQGHRWVRTAVGQDDDCVEVLACRRCGHVDETVLRGGRDARTMSMLWQQSN